jgi:hydrogenase maturation protease
MAGESQPSRYAGAPRVLVIGMGNVLMQDEGIGVRAVEELETRYRLPANVRVVDGGTTGMELFEPMRNADCLIVADAVNAAYPPGSLVRIANEEIRAFFQTKLSNHQLGLSDLLALLAFKGETPRHVAIVGMVPHALENRLGLSAPVTAGLDDMVRMLVDELARVGVAATPRERVRAGHWRRQAELEHTDSPTACA